MKAPQTLRRGTPPFVALTRIHALGGIATVQQIQKSVQSYFISTTRLDQMVMRPLMALGFIESVKKGVQITPAGREYIESDSAPTSGGRSKLGSTALSAETETYVPPKFMQMVERRPGSLEYRNIPSLIGGKEVPFAVGSLASSGKDGEKQ